MKTILVPTDFSKAAINAAEYAINLANELQAKVLLLHVYNAPVLISTDVPVIVPMPEELHQENEARLKAQVEQLKKRATVEIRFKALMGLPVSEILEEGKNADFIVMGMRNAGKLSELLLGSITTAIIKKAVTPVFVIPEAVTYKTLKKIVLATDYDIQTNTNIFEPLKKLIKLFNLKVYIIHIKTEKEVFSVESVIAASRVENEFADVEHLYYYPEKEDLVEGINEFVRNKQADLVVLVPHRYNWIKGLFHRSSSKRIAFHADVPLLTLPDISIER